MSDFLKNLRNSQDKSRKTRKTLGSGYYYQQKERRSLKGRRDSDMTNASLNELAEQLTQSLPLINESISVIASSIERMTDIQEALAEVNIEQHKTIIAFIQSLSDIFESDDHPRENIRSKPAVTTSYASGTRYTKDEIMSLIQAMRDEGATFSRIADYLKEKSIPTFSGRGDWHAQTIHRLCKEEAAREE